MEVLSDKMLTHRSVSYLERASAIIEAFRPDESEKLGLRFANSCDIYRKKQFLEGVKELKKTAFFSEINNETRFLLCNSRFFLVSEKPAAKKPGKGRQL